MNETHPTMARVFERTGLEPSALALKINTSPQNITNWSKRGISKKGAMDVSRVFGLSLDWVLTGEGEIEKPAPSELMQKIKDIRNGVTDNSNPTPVGTTDARMVSTPSMVSVLSWVAAGSWSNTEAVTMDDVIGEAPRPPNLSSNGFALRVQGRSMLPKFEPDDIIYVEPQTGLFALKDSDLVVVQCNEDTEATFKQLVIGDTFDDMYLKPLNPDWHDQRMMPMGDCNLVGKVVGKYVEF